MGRIESYTLPQRDASKHISFGCTIFGFLHLRVGTHAIEESGHTVPEGRFDPQNLPSQLVARTLPDFLAWFCVRNISCIFYYIYCFIYIYIYLFYYILLFYFSKYFTSGNHVKDCCIDSVVRILK